MQRTHKRRHRFRYQTGASYTEQQETLQPGDIIAIYSDGITEAVNPQDNFFEKQRLIDMIIETKDSTVNIIGEKILTTMKAFITSDKPSDDISLILLKSTRRLPTKRPPTKPFVFLKNKWNKLNPHHV